jgi:nitrogen regulatory protein PII
MNLRNEMESTKDHIDCILYLIKSSNDRIFMEMEIKLIEKLLLFDDIEIIFVSNTFGKEEESDEYYKNKEIIEDCLETIMKRLKLKEEKIDKIIDSIVYVNLVKKMKNTTEVECNLYGIDKLLSTMYELMSKKKIDEAEITKIKNSGDLKVLIEEIQKYPLLKMFKNRGDFKVKNRIELSKYILSCAKGDFWKDFFIIGLFTLNSRRKDMIKKISEKYGEKFDNVDDKLEEITKKIYKDSDNIIQNFFETMKPYKSIFEVSGFDFNPYFYNTQTIAIGNYLLNQYEEKSFLFDKNAFKTILDLSIGINNGIEGLNQLSNEWEIIMEDIKEGKSDKEWVRRFFNLDKKN